VPVVHHLLMMPPFIALERDMQTTGVRNSCESCKQFIGEANFRATFCALHHSDSLLQEKRMGCQQQAMQNFVPLAMGSVRVAEGKISHSMD